MFVLLLHLNFLIHFLFPDFSSIYHFPRLVLRSSFPYFSFPSFCFLFFSFYVSLCLFFSSLYLFPFPPFSLHFLNSFLILFLLSVHFLFYHLFVTLPCSFPIPSNGSFILSFIFLYSFSTPSPLSVCFFNFSLNSFFSYSVQSPFHALLYSPCFCSCCLFYFPSIFTMIE